MYTYVSVNPILHNIYLIHHGVPGVQNEKVEDGSEAAGEDQAADGNQDCRIAGTTKIMVSFANTNNMNYYHIS